MSEQAAAPAQGKAAPPAERGFYEEVVLSLRAMESEFAKALPKTMRAEHFCRVLVTTIRTAYGIDKVTKQSIYTEAMKAAQDGLLLDGREAALIPFGGVAKYMPMTYGMCKRAKNSGDIGTIDAQVVYKDDEFEYWIDEKGPHFKHIPNIDADRTKVKCAYAYAITKEGFLYFERMTAKELEDVEKVSKNKKDSPYDGPFRGEMQRKAPLRRLLKYRVPSSADVAEMLDRDNDMYDFEARADKAKPAEGGKPVRTSRVGKVVDAKANRDKDPDEFGGDEQQKKEPETKPEPGKQEKKASPI